MNSRLVDTPTLLVHSEPGILRVTINRPRTRNALAADVVRDLSAVSGLLEQSGDMRVVVLRGSEGNFCAGGDIDTFHQFTNGEAPGAGDADPLADYNHAFGELLLRWHALPQVTIALIEGAARGGGIGLACACDLALATGDATFAVSEARIGVVPAQIAPFLVTRVGLGAARVAALTARAFDARQACEIGLIDELCDDRAALETAGARLIRDILRCGPEALAATKSLLLRVGSEPVANLMRDAAQLFAVAARGPEGREGIAAFMEKRTPAWALRATGEG